MFILLSLLPPLALGVVEGFIVDKQGKPFQGVTVSFEQAGVEKKALSGADGKFSVSPASQPVEIFFSIAGFSRRQGSSSGSLGTITFWPDSFQTLEVSGTLPQNKPFLVLFKVFFPTHTASYGTYTGKYNLTIQVPSFNLHKGQVIVLSPSGDYFDSSPEFWFNQLDYLTNSWSSTKSINGYCTNTGSGGETLGKVCVNLLNASALKGVSNTCCNSNCGIGYGYRLTSPCYPVQTEFLFNSALTQVDYTPTYLPPSKSQSSSTQSSQSTQSSSQSQSKGQGSGSSSGSSSSGSFSNQYNSKVPMRIQIQLLRTDVVPVFCLSSNAQCQNAVASKYPFTIYQTKQTQANTAIAYVGSNFQFLTIRPSYNWLLNHGISPMSSTGVKTRRHRHHSRKH